VTDSDVIVIGGGISGLSFAYRCAEIGLGVLLLEDTPRLGGCIHSQHLPSGYWFEMGAHTCYNSYGGLIQLIEKLELRDRITARAKVPFRLLKNGQLRSIPRELSVWEAVRSLPHAFRASREGHTVQSYYSRLVGPGNYDRVLSPMLAAVPSQNADAFPATMLFKKRPRRKDVMRTFTLAGGLQTLIDALARHDRLATNTDIAVRSIEPDGRSLRVDTVDGQHFSSRYLALAIPPPKAADLLRGAFPELAARLAQIQAVAVDSVGVVVSKSKLTIPPVAGIVPTADVFYSAVTRDTVPDDRYRAFAFHFRPDTPAPQRLERVSTVLAVSQRDFETVVERRVVLPSPLLGHHTLVHEIDRLTADLPLFLTGNYFAGLAIEDCIERSSTELTRLQRQL
jgi:oxygen-dependent protoporphyrinogen oxidase